MNTHRMKTFEVEVEAFRWTGELKEMRVLSTMMPGDYILRFPDGHIEKRTPEEFVAQFEPISIDVPVDHIPRVLDALRRAWELNPKWPLGELLGCAVEGFYTEAAWHMKNDDVIAHLEKWITGCKEAESEWDAWDT